MRYSCALICMIALGLIGASFALAGDMCSTPATTPDAFAPIREAFTMSNEERYEPDPIGSEPKVTEVFDMSAAEEELLNLMNEERKNIQALTISPVAKEAARIHTVDAVTTLIKEDHWIGHDSRDESIDDFEERMRIAEKKFPKEPFFTIGENVNRVKANFDFVARKMNDPKAIAKHIHELFMERAGHRANILDPNYNRVGVSVKSIKLAPMSDGRAREFPYQIVTTVFFAGKRP